MTDHPAESAHQGPDHSAPYPVSRLAPAFAATDIGAEVAQAEAMLGARTGAKLRVIADQIQALQEAARRVLAEAREEQALTRAQCAFKRIPGKTYHLYRKSDGATFFSMLSPADWRGAPPHPFVGSYRLEPDYAWTSAELADQADAKEDPVRELLARVGLEGGQA